jgi:hypothetical protein
MVFRDKTPPGRCDGEACWRIWVFSRLRTAWYLRPGLRVQPNVNVSFVGTSATALNEDLRLEVAAACAFDIVAYMVAVFFGGEPRDSEFAAVDAQPRNVHGFRRCGICDLNDLLKVFVGLRLARARVSLKKVAPTR